MDVEHDEGVHQPQLEDDSSFNANEDIPNDSIITHKGKGVATTEDVRNRLLAHCMVISYRTFNNLAISPLELTLICKDLAAGSPPRDC